MCLSVTMFHIHICGLDLLTAHDDYKYQHVDGHGFIQPKEARRILTVF